MAHRKGYLALLWAMLLSGASAVPDDPVRSVDLQFTVFALNPIKALFYRAAPKEPPAPLQFYAAYRSPAYAYRGPHLLEFFQQNGVMESRTPVAIWDAPAESGKVLLFFFPSIAPSADRLKYDVVAMDDTSARIPPGHVAIYNFSGRSFAGRMGSTDLAVPVGFGGAHRVSNHGMLRLFSEIEGQRLQVATAGFDVGERERVLIVLFPPAERGGLAPVIRKLAESLPPASGETSTNR